MRRMSLRVLSGVLASTWLLAAADLAWAAEEGHGGKRNIFELAIDLGVWTVVVFLVLMFILKKYAWGPMLEGLQKREENLHAAVDEARKAREEAAHLRDFLAQERAKIGEEARKVTEQAHRRGEELVAEMQAEARKLIQEDRDRLLREISMAKDQALKQLWDQTAQLATLVSAKAIQRQISPDDHRRLVDEALAELKQAGEAKYREVATVRA